jgi:broad specificity phosphatase PhoE
MHKYLNPLYMGRLPFNLAFFRHPASIRNEGGNQITVDPTSPIGTYSDRLMPVSGKGHKQVELTVPAIIKQYPRPSVIIHSGYTRTETFASAVAEGYQMEMGIKVPVVWDVSVRERDQGCNSHMSAEDDKTHFSWIGDYWQRNGPLLSRPPSGESLADVLQNRTIPFLNRVCARYHEGTVLVFTHSRFMITARWAIEDELSYEDVCALTKPENAPKNCSLLSYEYCVQAGKLKRTAYNTIFY